ncbi:Prefoldin subunit-domain-containing protein [Tuber borchii]|uniref:Prefoldin subunit-domain-containing protein n=1 Tax=Tuber borchii TaxID=42251 RepID=A0A2T6ZWM0_TUBBO|nr:Prefoldin subunit-domain-containing protein [Tuber borchii]
MPIEIERSLELHRQRLEASLEKLRKALRHWQVSSAEYEALREELQTLPGNSTREDMMKLKVGSEFGGTVVDEKDVKALLGDNVGIKRTVDQAITAVGHRINYVQENVDKVQKQIDQGEAKLASLLVVSEPDLETEDGLPIMDIREELDEDGNIINTTINGADPSLGKVLDTAPIEQLQKLVEKDKDAKEQKPPVEPSEGTSENKPAEVFKPSPQMPSPSIRKNDKTPAENELDGVKPISSKDGEGGGFVRVLDDPVLKEEDFVKEVPTDSPEEAEMRKQMLNYNLQEIGAVVAEINLEEEGIYYGHEDDLNEETDELDSEDEDRYGRTATRVITPEYQKEMEDLARKIKERGEAARAAEAKMREEDSQQRKDEAKAQKPKPKKKGVRFAPEPEISPAPPLMPDLPVPPSAHNTEDALPLLVDLLAMDAMRRSGVAPGSTAPAKEKGPSIFKSEKAKVQNEKVAEVYERVVPVSVLSSNVMERSADDGSASFEPPISRSRNVSRFKAAMAAPRDDDADHDDVSPPKTSTNSSVIEREVSESIPVQPPDELDPSTHRAEVAVEYHRLRNKMIQQQGGFVESEEEMAKVPLDDDGETRKVSRFKAARMKGLAPS